MKKSFLTFAAIAALALVCACGPKEDQAINDQLDKYEQVCKQVAELTPKAMSGDSEALSQLQTASTEMSNLAMELGNEAGKMSTSQANRFADLSMEASNAASNAIGK